MTNPTPLARILAHLVFTTTLSVSVASAEIPKGDRDKILKAAPGDAPAKPRKPRKVLVFSRMAGFKHLSTPWGAEALRILGEKTGAYEPVLSDDLAMFDRDNLFQFDAVIFNNNCDSGIESPTRRKNLLDFVRGGRGLVGIHCAAHPKDWPEFVEMLGGYSVSHPWQNGDAVVIRIEEPEHPAVRAFAGSPLTIVDEIYEFDQYERAKLRVLISIDTAKTDMTKPGIARKDGDFALSWVRNYGKGRVFYCAFGHELNIYWDPAILRHYLAGIQFALGDLEADATPRVDREKRSGDESGRREKTSSQGEKDGRS
ncbi:MAG TPA: ThuA domain-containing protein [Sumerlaeia bacterium]|nr:ThuA domain-containing protein [Sumerlaeia bacterium]